MPLVAVAADEAVEVLEAETARPEIEWPGAARHPVRHVVHLPEPRGVVSVLSKHLAHRAGALRHEGVVTGVARRHLRDDTARVGVVIASCDQRGSGRRAQRRRVEGVVAEPALREALEVRRLDRSAEGATRAEPHVVGEDQEDVRRALRRLHTLREVGHRILRGAPDLAVEGSLGLRQDLLSGRRGRGEGRDQDRKPSPRRSRCGNAPLRHGSPPGPPAPSVDGLLRMCGKFVRTSLRADSPTACRRATDGSR